MDHIIFRISKYDKIELIPAGEIKDLCYCSQAKIIYSDLTKSLELYNYCTGEILEILKIKLEKVLANKLKLHTSIQMDIGFLLNEFLQKKQALPLSESGMGTDWIGIVNLLWSTDKLATWLYNKDNKIFLEITPVYSWHFVDPELGEPCITYDEFIKNYKPIAIIEIAKDIAKQWLKQTEELLDIVNKNDAN